MVVPAGRATNGPHAERGEAAKVFGRGGRSGEFDGDRGAVQRLAGKRGDVLDVKARAHLEAVFRGELLDEAAHFAGAYDCEWRAHEGAAPVARSWRTMRA